MRFWKKPLLSSEVEADAKFRREISRFSFVRGPTPTRSTPSSLGQCSPCPKLAWPPPIVNIPSSLTTCLLSDEWINPVSPSDIASWSIGVQVGVEKLLTAPCCVSRESPVTHGTAWLDNVFAVYFRLLWFLSCDLTYLHTFMHALSEWLMGRSNQSIRHSIHYTVAVYLRVACLEFCSERSLEVKGPTCQSLLLSATQLSPKFKSSTVLNGRGLLAQVQCPPQVPKMQMKCNANKSIDVYTNETPTLT